MDQVKALAIWTILLAGAMIFLTLALTGRLGILASIAFLPDNVGVIGN